MKSKKNSEVLYRVNGGHRTYLYCRFCKKGVLKSVINLGSVPLAGGFVEKKNIDRISENYYPLTLGFCNHCKMLQTIETVDQSTLFEKYYYATSKIKTLSTHFEKLAVEIADSLKGKNGFVVEIGANDGVLIQNLIKNNINALGVDPAKNIVIPKIKKGLPLICDYFNVQTAEHIIKKYAKADVITSSNTMAHIEDIGGVYEGIKKLLNKRGFAIIEVHYLFNLIQEFQYDMIYHEHLYYYSVHSMKNILALFGLELYDAKTTSIHAGSIRFYIQHVNGRRKVSANVYALLKKERALKIQEATTYTNFNASMEKKKKLLLALIKNLKSKSKSIAGYGASGRANTIMSYCGIGQEYLDYIVDDSPLKQGRYTPGNGLRIFDSKILKTNKRPDYLLLFAWAFYDEIVGKNSDYLKRGGRFILPLPTIKITQ